MNTVKKILEFYDSGRVTEREIVSLLFGLPATQPMSEILTELPSEWCDKIRKECQKFQTEDSRKSLVTIITGCFESEESHRRAREDLDRCWRIGLIAWSKHFGITVEGVV